MPLRGFRPPVRGAAAGIGAELGLFYLVFATLYAGKIAYSV